MKLPSGQAGVQACGHSIPGDVQTWAGQGPEQAGSWPYLVPASLICGYCGYLWIFPPGCLPPCLLMVVPKQDAVAPAIRGDLCGFPSEETSRGKTKPSSCELGGKLFLVSIISWQGCEFISLPGAGWGWRNHSGVFSSTFKYFTEPRSWHCPFQVKYSMSLPEPAPLVDSYLHTDGGGN